MRPVIPHPPPPHPACLQKGVEVEQQQLVHAHGARHNIDERDARLKPLPPALQPPKQLLRPALQQPGVRRGGAFGVAASRPRPSCAALRHLCRLVPATGALQSSARRRRRIVQDPTRPHLRVVQQLQRRKALVPRALLLALCALHRRLRGVAGRQPTQGIAPSIQVQAGRPACAVPPWHDEPAQWAPPPRQECNAGRPTCTRLSFFCFFFLLELVPLW